jgi:hypothetical protein
MALRGKRGVAGGRVGLIGLVGLVGFAGVGALATEARAEVPRAAPRPFVVADLSDESNAGLALTLGRSGCDVCNDPKVETTSLIAMVFADFSIRPGLKLWVSLPLVHRDSTAGTRRAPTHDAYGQLTVGVRQIWELERAWRPRLSAGASFSGTPRTGTGDEAGFTIEGARLISGLHPSHFDTRTTTTRLHGDVAVSEGRAFAQLGLALMLRAPDERELRSEVGFEALLGARLTEQVAVLGEVTASVLDRSFICPRDYCGEDRAGFPQFVSGNLGVRVSLCRVLLGARLILPLIDGTPLYMGGPELPLGPLSPSFSLEAAARF